ncbi:E3 ubiquitin-protein ligase RNF181-like [Rhodamnia argentea]|uniref:E3 ubiquitin-protein ligase RNF181-like n=1 Tax=Rhodamnia argentea TaxID=178133 RepID=A0ABM3HA37_9MYRT|nr:E3 ubiquitin-protein ligase RNF181-like [Rhodamnia argentea]
MNAIPPDGEVVNPEAAPEVLAPDPVTTIPAEEDGEVVEPLDAEQSPELDEAELAARYGMENIVEVSTGGYESDPNQDQVTQGVSRSAIEKLERNSCCVWDGGGCCCICLEELNGVDKVMEIPCSHLFHSKCIVKWFERTDSCPLCRSKVEVEDPE